MKISNKLIAVILASLVFMSAAVLLVASRASKDETTARIYIDGSLFSVIDLKSVKEPYILEIGTGNTALVGHGTVAMHSANCPDKLCVKTGEITSGLFPIVCLPNKVMIVISSLGSSADIDSAAG